MNRQRIIGVIGAGRADDAKAAVAADVGRLVAERGHLLVCGGLGGVMEAASRGAWEAGGITLGILPGIDRYAANRFTTIPVATGLNEGRNLIIIRTADILIAIGGEYGTLSEIAFALKCGKTVIGLDTWDIPGVIRAGTPEQAIQMAVEMLGRV